MGRDEAFDGAVKETFDRCLGKAGMNRILIVEDDRDIAGNLLLLLKKEGFTAVAVGTREESLEQMLAGIL